jgi:hypothetical protein
MRSTAPGRFCLEWSFRMHRLSSFVLRQPAWRYGTGHAEKLAEAAIPQSLFGLILDKIAQRCQMAGIGSNGKSRCIYVYMNKIAFSAM